MDQQLGDKVLKDIKSDFMVQGTHRVHNWYAYAIIGIVMGMAVGIIYVANRNARFDASNAAMMPNRATTAQYTAPAAQQNEPTVFNTFLSEWREEHDNRTPKSIIVRPGTLVTGPEERDDKVELGVEMTIPFRSLAQRASFRQYISSFTKPYEIFFSEADMKNQMGNLIFPVGTWQNSDYANMFNSQVVIAGATKRVPVICYIKGEVTMTAYDKEKNEGKPVMLPTDEKGQACRTDQDCKDDLVFKYETSMNAAEQKRFDGPKATWAVTSNQSTCTNKAGKE